MFLLKAVFNIFGRNASLRELMCLVSDIEFVRTVRTVRINRIARTVFGNCLLKQFVICLM